MVTKQLKDQGYWANGKANSGWAGVSQACVAEVKRVQYEWCYLAA